MAMTFYDNNGIKVTDTTFITPEGDQYPIRNITSVQVRQNQKIILLIIAALIFLNTITKGMSAKAEDYVIGFAISAALVAAWWFTRKYILFIGAGGTLQKAIVYKRHLANVKILSDVATALNASIANLQKT